MPTNGNLSIDDVLDQILQREGGYVDNPADKGGPTAYGVTKRDHPDLWNPGPPTKEQARARLSLIYVQPFDLLAEMGVPDRVRTCVIDDAVLSGVVTAVKNLQRAVDVSVDGLLGPITARAAANLSSQLLLERLVHQRCRRYFEIIKADNTQATFGPGWCDRAFLFLA